MTAAAPGRKRQTRVVFAAALAVAVFAPAAYAASTPAQKCEASKNGAAGKYNACIFKAQRSFVARGSVDTAGRDEDLQRCADKLAKKWGAAESRAMGQCPTTGDEAGVRSSLDSCAGDVQDAMGGAELPECVPALERCEDWLATCSSDCVAAVGAPLGTGQTGCYDVTGAPVACAGTGQDGELRKGAVHSFTDNGDGTITDNVTGLVWEKMSDDGSIHDQDNAYDWDGAFATKVAALNAASFAGHDDWRVPNLAELRSIRNLDGVPATFTAFDSQCSPGCTVLDCSCTKPLYHWSSTSYVLGPTFAWVLQFNYGYTMPAGKTSAGWPVRAVRGGA